MYWSLFFLAISGIALVFLWRDVQRGATSILGFTRPVTRAANATNFWLAVAVQALLFGYVFGSSLLELLPGVSPATQ
jgi:hypothetical protein